MNNPRELFFNRVYDMVKNGEDIMIVTSDLAGPSLDNYRQDFPEHYLSVGIAEQSQISTSCGLALGGKKVIAWGVNPFIVTRALDQIRNTVSLMNIPIVFLGLQAGLSGAILGPSHVALTDLSLIRTCENITTYNPSDLGICKDIFDDVLQFNKPCYVRIDNGVNYNIDRNGLNVNDGFSKIRDGRDLLVLTTGYHVNICADVVDSLNSDIALIDVFKFPCNKSALAEEIKKYKKIITIEEHLLQGGFGSFVLEIMADHEIVLPVKRAGIDSEKGCYEFYGDRKFFNEHFGLDKDGLTSFIKKWHL